MSCNCHGKSGEKLLRRAKPDDQCTTCARKHVNNALAAWGEFTYEEDNRLWCAGQLRLAAEHLKYDHFTTALKCRDLAVTIEENHDRDKKDVASQLAELLHEVCDIFAEDHPEVAARLKAL